MLTAEYSPTGAELIGLTENATGIPYIWGGDPKFWSRRAPVLFPIVGKLKNGSMLLYGKKYKMNQHGFIRDMAFIVRHHDESTISWECISNEETKTKFPFD